MSDSTTDERSTKSASGWLTAYIVLLYSLPTSIAFGPLGAAGVPCVLFGFVSLMIWAGTRKRYSPVGGHSRDPVRIALTLFVLSVGISYVVAMTRAIGPDEVSPADFALVSVASLAGILLTAHDCLPRQADFVRIARVLALGGGALALLGIVQFATGQTLVDRISIPGMMSFLGSYSYERQGFTRPSGTAVHPIEYGVLLTMLLPFALFTAFNRIGHSAILRWLPVCAMALVIPLSLSRSVMIGTVLCLAVLMPTWGASRRRLVYVAVPAIVALMFVAVPGLIGSLRGMFVGIGDNSSITSRTDSYQLAVDFIHTSPLFGRGLGTFLPKYRIFDNQYLGLLVSVGTIGLITFIALIAAAVFSAAKTRRLCSDQQTRDLAQAMTASCAVGAAGLAMFDAIYFPMTMGTLFIVLGLAGGLLRTRRAGTQSVRLEGREVAVRRISSGVRFLGSVHRRGAVRVQVQGSGQ